MSFADQTTGPDLLGRNRVVPHVHYGRGVITVEQFESDGCATGVVEEPDPVAQQHRRYVQVDLVDKAAFEELSADRGREDLELDVRTRFGVVRVYRFAGAQPTKAPLVLLPGWASASLPALLKLRSVYTIDLLGEPGLSTQDRPITSDADQAQWKSE